MSFYSDTGKFKNPCGIAVSGGFVYIVDQGNNRIQKFDLDGAFETSWNSSGSIAGKLNAPCGIAVAGGYVYVTDTGNKQVRLNIWISHSNSIDWKTRLF